MTLNVQHVECASESPDVLSPFNGMYICDIWHMQSLMAMFTKTNCYNANERETFDTNKIG
jgi:hypothetical protein